mgnify:CR=1 FL=1
MKDISVDDAGEPCPDCQAKLHVGQERFSDGLYMVEYCKKCGFRVEKPLKE